MENPIIKIRKNLLIAKIDIPAPIGIIGLFISVQVYFITSNKLSFVSAKVVFVTPKCSLERYFNNSNKDE